MLLLGVIFALLAFVVLYLALSRPTETPGQVAPTPVPKAQVVVAARDIKGFTPITPEDVTLKDMEVNQILTPTLSTGQLVIGKMVTRDYKANDQIIATDVADLGISQILTKGQKAFVLPVKEVDNFGGQIVDGDVVDVLWTRTFELTTLLVGPDGKPTQVTKPLPSTKKVLDNIKIVRVIQLRPTTAKESGSGPVNPNGGQQPSDQQSQATAQQAAQTAYGPDALFTAALVLSVTDQQAEVIKYARETGVVDLTLRARDDTDVERTTGITDKIMVEDYGVQIPELIVK
jgi:Flp pilus assembly protein CpaB